MTAAQVRDGSLRNWLDERAKRPEARLRPLRALRALCTLRTTHAAPRRHRRRSANPAPPSFSPLQPAPTRPRTRAPQVPAFVVHPEVLCNAWSWVGRKGGRPSSGAQGGPPPSRVHGAPAPLLRPPPRLPGQSSCPRPRPARRPRGRGDGPRHVLLGRPLRLPGALCCCCACFAFCAVTSHHSPSPPLPPRPLRRPRPPRPAAPPRRRAPAQFGAYFNASERPHYWDWERPKPGRERVHPFEEEARVYGDLERAGLLRVH